MRTTLKILSGLAIALMLGACRSTELTMDRNHPILEIDSFGVKLAGEYVEPKAVPKLLEKRGIPKEQVLHIKINRFDHLRDTVAFRGLLAKAGYKKSVVVTGEIAESWTGENAKHESQRFQSTPKRPRVRMRRADEE